jgi:hypothetical protein
MSKHLAKFAEYAAVRRAYEEAKAAANKLEQDRRKLEQELVDAMLDDGVKSFALDAGMTVSLRKRFDCSVNQDNGALVEEWLQTTVGDVRKFQKLVLYKPAVVAYLKDLDKKEELDLTTIPPFLNLKTTPGVTVRGWQGAADDDE